MLQATVSSETYNLAPFFIEFLSLGYGYPQSSKFYNKKALKFYKPKILLEEMLATQSTYSKYQKYNVNTMIIFHCLAEPDITIDDVDTLLAGDKQKFLIHLKIMAYTEVIELKLKCSDCEHSWDKEFSLIECATEQKLGMQDMVDFNVFEVTLPMSKAVINYSHSSYLPALTPSTNTETLITNEIEDIKNNIVSINEITNKQEIEKIFFRLKAGDSRILREHYKKTKPIINIMFPIKCESCGMERVDEFFCNNYIFQTFPEDYDNVINESYFILGYYFGMSWYEYLNTPIKNRKFLCERINKEIAGKKDSNGDAVDLPTKGPHDNTPELRQLTGKTKIFGSQNSRTQRFT